MNAYRTRRVPWTCEWGRFGVAVEEPEFGRARLDDVFWGCRCPSRGAPTQMTRRGECETCPFWTEAARLRVQPPSPGSAA
jgi:hypothetical protein